MHCYLNMMRAVLQQGHGAQLGTRNGGYLMLLGQSMQVAGDFPLLTTKKINYDYVLKELLWFISGSQSVKPLQEMGCPIWNPWAREDGSVGPLYGSQWRNFGGSKLKNTGTSFRDNGTVQNHWTEKHGPDQLENSLELLCERNNRRDNVVVAWNPSDRDKVVLPWCHFAFQLCWNGYRYVDLIVYQRSADLAVGVPYNMASYATLLRMYCMLVCNRKYGGDQEQCVAGQVHFCFGNLHLYQEHFDLAKEQIQRLPKALPRLKIENRGQKTFDDFEYDDFELTKYDPWPHIPFEVKE